MSVLESSFSISQLDCALPCDQSTPDILKSHQSPSNLAAPSWALVMPDFESIQALPEQISIDLDVFTSLGLANYQPELLSEPAADKQDPLFNDDAAVYQLSNSDETMLFYTPTTNVAALESLTEKVVSDGNTIVAGVSSLTNNAAASNAIDITDLPDAILNVYPGLNNAIANDSEDDADTIQAVIDWIANERAVGNTPVSTIYIPEGTFDLAETITIKTPDIIFKGAGTNLTRLQPTNRFKVGTAGLPDGETVVDSVNRNAYLFELQQTADDVTFTNMTLSGPEIHGAIFGNRTNSLTIKNAKFNDFLWSSVRLFSASNAKIHDNVFIDAGGQAEGETGVTGGSIFATHLKKSEIYNNRIFKSREREGNVYGIKGRQFMDTRIHNNTIKTNFAIELPFEHDSFVEIDHNFLGGVISVPKFSGGKVPQDGYTFHIHHNYFNKSYALEWARNGAEVNNNVFVFDPAKDNGNLISNFDPNPAQGPTKFHNNLIVNPGRGIAWHKGIYNNFAFYNNEVIANKTAKPRKDGLFGFNPDTDFSTIEIRDNVIRANGTSRPLMRNQESYGAIIENNQLVNISDVNQFENPDTGKPKGLLEPLFFEVGVRGEFTIDGADLTRASEAR